MIYFPLTNKSSTFAQLFGYKGIRWFAVRKEAEAVPAAVCSPLYGYPAFSNVQVTVPINRDGKATDNRERAGRPARKHQPSKLSG